MRCAEMLGRNFECGTCLHLFIQNCFARAMRFQCGHSMCSTWQQHQQLVGQDMQGQALTTSAGHHLFGEWSMSARKDKALVFKFVTLW